jgi:hypothetical protein
VNTLYCNLNGRWVVPWREQPKGGCGRTSNPLLSLQIVCLALASWAWLAGGTRARAFDFSDLGPLYSRSEMTLQGGTRMEGLGPLLRYERRPYHTAWAIPPFFYYGYDALIDSSEIDLLYPLATYDRSGAEFRVHILQLLSLAGGQTQTDQKTRRFTIFPIVFHQRSPNPELNYTAVLPFYGRIKNRLLRDEIYFVLFPIYVRSERRDVVTDNYLYPLFHLRRGEALRGWQFWPLVGHEKREPFTRIDQWGDEVLVPGHETRFVLWPIYLASDRGVGTENPQRQRGVLPLYTSFRSPLRDSTTYLWPLGFTVTEDRERKFKEWGAPWPFIIIARGEGKTVNRLWPLYGNAANPYLQSRFVLWPIYKYNRATVDPLDRERTRILFFVYSDIIERNTQTGTARHRTDFWPLFTARRDHNGDERLQIFAPLEPLILNNKSIERSYSPLWSVWRSEKNGQTGHASQSFLWNLYRQETTPTTRKCSLLFGLFHYQSAPEGRRWRLFYIPFGKRAPEQASPELGR